MLEYCLSENVRYSMHLKETEADNEMCFKNYGKDIVDLLEEIGFLTDRVDPGIIRYERKNRHVCCFY